MKKNLFFLILLLSFISFKLSAQCGGSPVKSGNSTSIGIVIYSNDTETIWNALRLANYAVSAGDTVRMFLLGKGVELDSLAKKNNDVKEQTELFLKSGGVILGCGTCLQSRNNLKPQLCKMSTMGDLYEIIRKSKTVLTF
jgi:hypothetical protein